MTTYEPKPGTAIDELEDELARAFEVIRGALQGGDAVVVSLDERHVQGMGEVADAALRAGQLRRVRPSLIHHGTDAARMR